MAIRPMVIDLDDDEIEDFPKDLPVLPAAPPAAPPQPDTTPEPRRRVPSSQLTPPKPKQPRVPEVSEAASSSSSKRLRTQVEDFGPDRVWQRSARVAVPEELQAGTASLALLLVSLDDRLLFPPPGFEEGCSESPDALRSCRNVARSQGSVPVVDLHGVTRHGVSVLLHVHGFRPYFYVTKPSGEVDLEACLQSLDRVVRSNDGGVDMLEEVEKTPLMNFQPNAERFIRVVVSSPKCLKSCKSKLEYGLTLPGGVRWQSQAFEVVQLPQRILVDVAGAGGGWFEVPPGRFRLRPWPRAAKTSTAQLEADTHYSCLVAHAAEAEWLQLAPLRMLSLHLRCAGSEGSICAAGAVLRTQGQDDEFNVAWAVSDKEGPAPGPPPSQLVPSEAVLLEKLRDFIVEADPDILLGYDLLNGHLASAISRAGVLKIRAAGSQAIGYCLGRLRGVSSRLRNSTFETPQMGKHETKEINIDGRLLFDVLTILEREHKLSSYTLSALSQHFLKESRLELRNADIDNLSREAPWVLAKEAMKDAGIAMRLFQNQHCLFRYVEMGRVTGVPMEYLLTRGQSVKVLSMLLRKARSHGFILPPGSRGAAAGSVEDGPGATSTYEGGAVLEPVVGFYDEPVVTLDFASLYPSIMQKHNLCYSTMLPPQAPKQVAEDGSGEILEEVVPGLGHRFVSSRLRRGLVPMVLEELLSARAKAKKELKSVVANGGDPQLRAVLDGRQLALKISANSVYGFTGMSRGALPCQAIAASVTAYGRQMIERAKELVETNLSSARGRHCDARVVYGDTDSVMLTLGRTLPIDDVFSLGKEAAQIVSDAFGAPVKMEFEKVYHPFLLMNKKRYAGLSFGSPSDAGKLDFKGIEVVRRDWCLLVRQMVERSLQLLLCERSKERAVEYVRETVASLRAGRIDYRLLVLSKALVRAGAEEYAARQAHVELAERLRKADPAHAPKVGERVPYVFVAKGNGANACDRAEDPLKALEAGLPLDAGYYLDHQLKQPLLRVFEPVLGGSKSSVEHTLFGASGSSAKVPLRKAKIAPNAGGLAKFVRTKSRCVSPGCVALVEQSGNTLCKKCASDPQRTSEALIEVTMRLAPLEVECSRLLAQCTSCQGSICRDLHTSCVNTDCPIFFRRREAWLERREAEETLCKLRSIGSDW